MNALLQVVKWLRAVGWEGSAIKAVFVGINTHLDPTILELSDARRDATALRTLFNDTIDGLAVCLILDEAISDNKK